MKVKRLPRSGLLVDKRPNGCGGIYSRKVQKAISLCSNDLASERYVGAYPIIYLRSGLARRRNSTNDPRVIYY